eukprot:3110006-Rhodomonas_salina.2
MPVLKGDQVEPLAVVAVVAVVSVARAVASRGLNGCRLIQPPDRVDGWRGAMSGGWLAWSRRASV